MRARSAAIAVLVSVGVIGLLAGLVTGYARDTLTDSQEFADRTQVAFSDRAVRDAVTTQVVDQLVRAEPELLAVQPLLQSIVEGALGSELASDIVRAATADIHRSLFTDANDTVTMQLADLILVAKTQLTVIDPELGALIPDELTDALVSVPASPALVDLAQLSETLQTLSLFMPLVSIAALIAAVWLSDAPRRLMVRIGLAIVAGAAVVVVIEQLARWQVIRSAADEEVARAVWDAFLVDLGTWALVLAGIGALIAGVAWFGVGSRDVNARLEQVRHVLRRRQTTRGRLGWGAVTAGAGLVLVLNWEQALRFAVTVGGAALVAIGLVEILVTVFPGLVESASANGEGVERSVRGARVLGTVGLLAIGTLILVALWRSDGDGAAAADGDPGCNGSIVLCERPLDEVVLAATHNSNAAANDGFTFGYQTVGILPQLEDGIRGLLIDVYFGLDTDSDLVITDRAPVTAAERELLVAEMGESAVLAAEATVERSAQAGGRRDLYLCHAFCEIGARPFVDELEAIVGFLEDHPRQVIMMIIQDEGPTPDDMAGAFEASGLDELVYTHEAGAPWPTLQQMIDAGTRVVVSAENDSGQFAWYHDAFTLVQDTPFRYESVDEFACEPNRGTTTSPLLLVNHWLNPVSPTAATEANQADVLIERVERCRDERGRVPNLIAVDYHDRGDLLDVVGQLNGL